RWPTTAATTTNSNCLSSTSSAIARKGVDMACIEPEAVEPQRLVPLDTWIYENRYMQRKREP
ncbi:hypothetical protein, partial [Burkholderia cenocepacia]|uniref:hypothetical protein n=1 Tax=Burkholderia cenocepacia TaxID=95486 RepID=UPI001C4E01D3